MAEATDVNANHPASWDGEKRPLRSCDFESLDHPASVKLVEKDEKISMEKKAAGNEFFNAKNFVDAYELYSQALEYAPLTKDFDKNRAVFYSNRAACCLEMGRKEEAIEDCTRALEIDPKYLKALLRRSMIYEALDRLDESLADMDAALAIDPNQLKLKKSRDAMEVRVKEKNEKLKEEMMGQLKDLGNKFLGMMGLSLDNFKMEQDPATGSYSINFKQ